MYFKILEISFYVDQNIVKISIRTDKQINTVKVMKLLKILPLLRIKINPHALSM